MTARRVAIVADDLIWADRLIRAVEAAGGEPVRVRSLAELDSAGPPVDRAIVDLTVRAWDPLVAIEHARSRGARVLAVGQHDDHALRRRALAVGAERVYAYRRLFADGAGTIATWLHAADPAPAAHP